MKSNQKGFGLIEPLILIAVLFLIGIIGWYVWQSNSDSDDKSENTQAIHTVEATDSANVFSFSYPANWELQPYEWEGGHGPVEEPDWSKESKPITLHADGNKDAEVTIYREKYGDFWDSFDALKASVEEDYFAKILFDGQWEGRDAIFSRVDYLGPPDAKVESFTDHRYYFDDGTHVVRVDFREKYHHDWPDDEMGPDIDNSRYVADFEHIAKSIKFL